VFDWMKFALDLCPRLRMMQTDSEFGPGNGLNPASGNEYLSIVKPVSASNIEVAEVPTGLIHDKAFEGPKITVRCHDGCSPVSAPYPARWSRAGLELRRTSNEEGSSEALENRQRYASEIQRTHSRSLHSAIESKCIQIELTCIHRLPSYEASALCSVLRLKFPDRYLPYGAEHHDESI